MPPSPINYVDTTARRLQLFDSMEEVYLAFWALFTFLHITEDEIISCERCKLRKGTCRQNHYPLGLYLDPAKQKQFYDNLNVPGNDQGDPAFLFLFD